MEDQAIKPSELASQESAIELLARQTDTPVETVFKIYSVERAKLEEVARIKAYIPGLIHRRVKELLQTQGTA
jgi:hypothetical protein